MNEYDKIENFEPPRRSQRLRRAADYKTTIDRPKKHRRKEWH
jgi:hypothetical protein